MEMIAILPRRVLWRALQVAATVVLTLLVVFPAYAADIAAPPAASEAPPPVEQKSTAADKIDAEKLFAAIV